MRLPLPTGGYAYGRVLRDASLAIYRGVWNAADPPPIGDRDYRFVVGVYDDVLVHSGVQAVAVDPSRTPVEDWPPPYCVRDALTGRPSIYERGILRDGSEAECAALEPAAVWDWQHLVARIQEESKSGSR